MSLLVISISYLLFYLYKEKINTKKMIIYYTSVMIFNIFYYLLYKDVKYLVLINVIFPFFILICYFDFKEMIIPDVMLLIILLYFIILRLCSINIINVSLKNVIVGGIGIFLIIVILLILFHFKIEIIGFGDLKLLFVLNIVLGYKMIILNLFIASVTACFFELLIFKRKIFPFGPYIIIGFLIVILLYQILI